VLLIVTVAPPLEGQGDATAFGQGRASLATNHKGRGLQPSFPARPKPGHQDVQPPNGVNLRPGSTMLVQTYAGRGLEPDRAVVVCRVWVTPRCRWSGMARPPSRARLSHSAGQLPVESPLH